MANLNVNGTIILNGVTDKELETIFGFKAKHEGAFTLTPNGMQNVQGINGRGAYNNVHFAYNTPRGLNLITEVVNVLNKSEQAQ